MTWQDEAACRGVDQRVFFFDVGVVSPTKLAKARAICTSCTVSKQCLAAALEGDEYGIWAGTDRRQRHEMKRPFGWSYRTSGAA